MPEYVRDTFTRNTSSGLGTAEVGGAWADAIDAGWSAFVTGSNTAHQVGATTGGRTAHRLANAPSVTNAHGHMRWRGGGESTATSYATLILRAAGNTGTMSGYAFRVGLGVSNVLTADVRVLTADVLGSPIITRTALPTIGTTDWWHVEAELIGANPTRVRARWWRDADGPPTDDTGWQEVNDSTGPQGAGQVGLRMARGPGAGTPALTIRADGVYLADPMVPSFTALPDAVNGLTMEYDPATSTGDPVGWRWNYGDGTPVSLEKRPTHSYAAPGTYNVTLTLTTRWQTVRAVTIPVTVTGEVRTPPEGILPDVYIGGDNVCDRVYALQWRTGRARWPDETTGSALTIRLRGRMLDVVQGTRVSVQLPAGAPDGTQQLWTGEVDTVDEALDPMVAETSTTIVASDILSLLARWHILPDTAMDEHSLPYRLRDDLTPRAGVVYREKWPGVPAARWPLLKNLSMTADKLRSRTYLDMMKDALRASIASAYVARDGAVVYGPLDPPAMSLDAPYPDRVLSGRWAPKPHSYWKLGETAGLFLDTVANLNGSVLGTITRGVPALAGTDGGISSSTSGGASFSNIYSNPGAGWTVLAWLVWDGVGELYAMDKLKSNGAGGYTGWRVQVATNGELRIMSAHPTTGVLTSRLSGTVRLVAGRRTHVGWSVDTAGTYFYVDGELVATSGTVPMSSNSDATAPMASRVNGTLDELGFWRNARLSHQQVYDLYASVIDLERPGPDCASEITIARASPDGIVNRWTVGDGAAVDRVDRASIEAYGETAWTVGDGVLKAASTFPVTDAMAVAMRDPYPAAQVTIPIRSWAARSYLLEPLDAVYLGGQQVMGVLGVGHSVDLEGWTVTLDLDRDPWTLTGSTPPVPAPARKTRTQTFSISKDALLASPNMGAGRSTRNAIGLWSGTKFRGLFQFDLQYANRPLKIRTAKLQLWTAGQDMAGYGSTPQIHVDRVTGSWTEGSYGGGGPPWMYSTSNAVVYPGPGATTSGRKSVSVTNATTTLVEVDITAIVQSWANGSANRGVRIISQNESSTTRTIEFHTSESASNRQPKLVVTYDYAP